MLEIADALATASHLGPASDLALYWAYTSASFDELSSHHETAFARLADEIERGYPSEALFGGAAGAGWVVAHAAEDADALLATIDEALVAVLRVEPWTRDYDLISGLVGLGVYFLERGPAGREGLERVVDHLARTAIEDGDRITWLTAPALLSSSQRERSPAGYNNCGLAHGVAGVIALLGRLDDERAVRLSAGATRWLLAQPLDGSFPAVVDASGKSPSRTAWCYGDPGVALALWRAAPSRDVVELAVASLSRSVEQAGVFDADLCHGAAGLAHIANRFFHATGDERFRELAETWFDRVFDFHVPGEGTAGFRTYLGATPTRAATWTTRFNLLEGPIGIGLALQAATTDSEPQWDRLMLCDLPVI